MATKSFYQDMVIDTPEAAANLTELFESGIYWKSGNFQIEFAEADSELGRRLVKKFNPEK